MTQPEEMLPAGNLDEWLTWAETKVALSLAVSFFFKPPASAFADGLLECYREYLDLCGPQLQWYGSETSSKYSKAMPRLLQIPFRRLPEALGHGKLWSWMTYSGEDYRDAGEYQFYALVHSDADNQSSFRAAFPVRMFAGAPERFVELVKRFAERLPFSFGYAGFSFSESQEIKRKQVNEIYVLPTAMRFSGIEVESHTRTCQCCKDTIKGVNWLTLLSPAFVEKLGGKPTLEPLVEDGITLHDLPTGLMIQAGTAPELGDVNAGERAPLYRKVHAALEPIRVVDHWLLGSRGFQQDATRRWMSRFDD